MSDLQFLFAILVVLYGWECLCWLRRGSVGFTTWWGRGWRIRQPGTLLGNASGGVVLAPGLPPLGTIFTAAQYPFSLGPAGVLFFVAPNVNPGWRAMQSAQFVNWEAVPRLQWRGKRLWAGASLLYTAPTLTRAQDLRRQLQTLATAPESARPPLIAAVLRATLDREAVKMRWQEWRQRTRRLRYATNGLFAWVFLIAPLLIAGLGLRGCWPVLVSGLVLLNGGIAFGFARAHRHRYPAADDDRFTQTLILALAPATTIRALDYLSRAWLEQFHPLAVAQLLLPEQVFRGQARRWLLDLRHPAWPWCPNPNPQAVATEQYFRTKQLELTEAWLEEQGISVTELTRPAPCSSPECQSYCPRCETQFTTEAGTCADCGGIPLVTGTAPGDDCPNRNAGV